MKNISNINNFGKYINPHDSAYSKRTNFFVSLFFLFLSLIVFLPILLVIIISFSTEESVNELGYSFFPRGLSFDAYQYLFYSGNYLGRAFLNSIIITVIGTVFGLILMCPIAFALSRKEFRYRKIMLVFLMIPMLFSGGLVSSYMVNTQIFHLRNTYLALILPGLCSTWYIMILRNYFHISIPSALIEAAELDGANQFQILRMIILPIAKPVITTVSVFQSFAYWSSWYPSLLYLDSNHTELYPLQHVLVNMDRSIQTLTMDAQYIFILRIGSILNSDFGLFYQVPMDSGSLQSVTQTLDVYVYKALMQQANFSFSAAAAFLQSIVGFVLLMITNYIISRIDRESSLM
ncbi:carbohydrate ABC transporter permease [Oribacterium sp. WCC10]|uniref:carbohydrate ABC transporter permease n=1 Tax=Oribacterium sp. WCC10 TaxID=1855343 RepID=UPI000B87CF18|nr:carbohydrate ABC transporter permease [Oribacterium sp. WCC10]